LVARSFGAGTYIVGLGLIVWWSVQRLDVPVALAVVLVVVVGPLFLLWPRGSRVTVDRHADLHALVHDTAARVGLPPPGRVCLTGRAEVLAVVRDRSLELHVGQPLVRCLTADELSALIAHELSILSHRHAWLLSRLRAKWLSAVDDPDLDLSELEAGRMHQLRAVATPMEELADGAASAAAGPATAARAIVLAAVAGSAHLGYAQSMGLPGSWWADRAISDLDEGWRRLLSAGRADPGRSWDATWAAELAARHPFLAAEIESLVGQEPGVAMAPSPVRLDDLTVWEERRLARNVLDLEPLGIRWRTVATAPPRWWLLRAARDARKARRAVAAGKPPPPGASASLAEDELMRQRWRLEHPALRGALIGPDGERVALPAATPSA
jgi:hypothetical protein